MNAHRDIPFGKPILGEEEKQAAWEAMESGVLAHGPRGAAFEAAFSAYTGAPAAAALSSCTAGMHLVWHHLGLGPGDEVLVPAMTHVATAHAVAYTGARPVFADVLPDTGNVDPAALAATVTPRTRAVAVVHYLGLPADMDAVKAVAARHGLFVLEDCALALGSRHRGTHCGLLGDAGCFSFYPVKHITTAEGGMVISRDPALVDRVRKLRAFGMDKAVGERTVPGLYDVEALGYNYRMNEVQAAIGTEQLRRLPGFLEQRRANLAALRAALGGMDEIRQIDSDGDGLDTSAYCHVVLLQGRHAALRNEVVMTLRARGVGTSVYYPHPVPRMRYYAERFGYAAGSFPEAERIADTSIALPVGPHLREDDMVYIAGQLRQVLTEV
jgi:perosamine synthetase